MAQSLNFAPTDLGLPTHRLRKYTIFARKDLLKFHISWSRPSMEDVAWRSLTLVGKVFFRSPQSYQKRALKDLARRTNKPEKIGDKDVAPIDVLAGGDRKRLKAHIESAADRGLTFVCANARQTAQFYRCDGMIPVLTTKSNMIWGQDVGQTGSSSDHVARPLYAYEQLAAHGYPVLLPAKHRLSSLLPSLLSFRSMLSKTSLSESELRTMAGNGMHLAAVGLAILEATLGLIEIQPSEANDLRKPQPKVAHPVTGDKQ